MKKCQFHKWSQLTETEQRCRACGRKRRRIAKAKKKHRIAPVSKGRLSCLTLYRREIAKDKKDGAIVCISCGRRKPIGELDPHHPLGRAGSHILCYFWICKSLHRKIHANGKLARKLGWIRPEFDGRISLSIRPMPWLYRDDRTSAIKAGFTCDDNPINKHHDNR